MKFILIAGFLINTLHIAKLEPLIPSWANSNMKCRVYIIGGEYSGYNGVSAEYDPRSCEEIIKEINKK